MPSEAFVFEQYRYDQEHGRLSLYYRFRDGPRFEEQLFFDFTPRPLSSDAEEVLHRIFRLIFLMAGVSYYKASIPKLLVCEAFALSDASAEFLHKFYEKGLAEFAFRNGISLSGHFRFLTESERPPEAIAVDLPRRTCVPIGGGKDSIVTIECLKRASEPLLLFALGDAKPIEDCITATQQPFVRVRRRVDPLLLELNRSGALNGHVPITGILSAIALASAVMAGCDKVVMSNEHSASAPNLMLGGREINHQYSKSFEFEQDLAHYIEHFISPSLNYFSLLRPLSEIEIARRFAKYPGYFGIFRSCNTAFRQSPAMRTRTWCCNCPKCRFVFLALSPFVAKSELIEIFDRNLLDDPNQTAGFAELCGMVEHKPFECVGETSECAAVMSYLGEDRDWRDDVVVRRLNDEFPALRQGNAATYPTLFEVRHPHQVPASYMAMLDACG
jgi:UDP-N-acetyl-alpha-D-muramoyl-L-alanyl-L-glutamate epimerase